MKVKYQVVDDRWHRVKDEFDTEKEAEAYCKKGPPPDLMCETTWYIRKVWTNRK